MIDISHLSHVYPGSRKQPPRQALSDLTLSVREGEFCILSGPNGSGKSTLFRILCGMCLPSAGQVTIAGADLFREPHRVREAMAVVFQSPAVDKHLSVLENVRVALQRKRGNSFDFWRSSRVLDEQNGRARELIEDVGLAAFENTVAIELPYGRKRALEIATTLALDPEMMLLDEPTAGMAHDDVERIAALIKRVAANRTVLMVEHNLGVVEHLSDQITVLARGEVLAEGDYATVSRNPYVMSAYLGTEDG